jgi:hypothetical protein
MRAREELRTMSITPLKKQDDEVVIREIGTVDATEDGRYIVAADSGRFSTTKAVSCLVEPEIGDEVLFAGQASGDLYIIAILEREAEVPTKLTVEGDATLQVREGKLALVAKQGIDLVTGATLAMTSRGLKLNAREGDLFIDNLTFLGRKALAKIDVAKVFAGTLDSVLDRFSRRVKNSYRFVEQVDQVRSQQIDYAAKENMRLRAYNALMNADVLFKIDGDSIQLG